MGCALPTTGKDGFTLARSSVQNFLPFLKREQKYMDMAITQALYGKTMSKSRAEQHVKDRRFLKLT